MDDFLTSEGFFKEDVLEGLLNGDFAMFYTLITNVRGKRETIPPQAQIQLMSVILNLLKENANLDAKLKIMCKQLESYEEAVEDKESEEEGGEGEEVEDGHFTEEEHTTGGFEKKYVKSEIDEEKLRRTVERMMKTGTTKDEAKEIAERFRQNERMIEEAKAEAKKLKL